MKNYCKNLKYFIVIHYVIRNNEKFELKYKI